MFYAKLHDPAHFEANPEAKLPETAQSAYPVHKIRLQSWHTKKRAILADDP